MDVGCVEELLPKYQWQAHPYFLHAFPSFCAVEREREDG